MAISREMLGRPRFGLSRYVKSPVLEIGPGISPFPVPHGTQRILAEREFSGSIIDLFPELGADAVAPVGDVYLDLDQDGLRQFAPESLGSVIVSHVLEHTANPLRAIVEIHRVLRTSGRAVIALPDRRHTFDRQRPGTSVEHLASEFHSNITEVDDDHIIEFCLLVEGRPLADITPELIGHHRKRSIHAHCWTAEEFFSSLVYLTSIQEVSFDLVDFMGIEHSLGGSSDEEFIFVFEKSSQSSVERLLEQWAECVASDRVADVTRIESLTSSLIDALPLIRPGMLHAEAQLSGLLQLWFTHRDLRQFPCPLLDPEPLNEWACNNTNDPRATAAKQKVVSNV